MDDYTAPTPPVGGGEAGTPATTAATAAAAAAAAVGSLSLSKGKQIVQSSADDTWPETDVLLCHEDPACILAQTAVGSGDVKPFVSAVTAVAYNSLSQSAQLLPWALISRTPTLKVTYLFPR